MRNLLTTIALGILPLIVYSQDKVSDYISNYQHIAISEMNRSGIPASITLAQGMFESAYGQSPSAMGYNNHFGIKCKKEWTGPYFYKHDDDRDKDGKLVPSCFRAYASVDESFQDHTNFLVERERYAELFTYDQTDYYNWAMGLERCGYATNNMYAERLVEIIERYALHLYDNPQSLHATFASSENSHSHSPKIIPVATDAFSEITSASASLEVASMEVVEVVEIVKEKPVMVTTPILEEELNTIVVLGSFEEFSQVTVATSPIAESTDKVMIKEKKVEPTTISRVNQAIILPDDYSRKVEISQTGAAKMDRR